MKLVGDCFKTNRRRWFIMQQVNACESLHRLKRKLDKFREDRFVVFSEIHARLRKFLEMEEVGGWESI